MDRNSTGGGAIALQPVREAIMLTGRRPVVDIDRDGRTPPEMGQTMDR